MASAASQLVREVLREHASAVQASLSKYLESRAVRNEVYALAADYPRRGGRRMRASLCIASAQAFGAPLEDAIDSAVSLELAHNAFLVHDDIEDGSLARRGKPTLHELHGAPVAINVGDALAVMSLSPLLNNRERLGDHMTLRILQEMERLAQESVEGQALELSWRRHNRLDLDERDYLGMILRKTCWYTTIYPCRVGALIATRDQIDLDRFVRFGFFLGAAFQIQDDILNLIGDPERYGKELSGDLWEGKRTLMLLSLMQRASPRERARLAQILALERAQRDTPDIEWMLERMHHYGCIEHARQLAHAFAGAALFEFEAAYGALPDSRAKCFLRALANWVLERA